MVLLIKNKKEIQRAQAALSLVFLIGGIAILIGLTLSFVAISFINASFGFQSGSRALAVATSGVEDAMMRLNRNKDFSDTGYTLPVGNYSATVVITQDSPAVGQVSILSVGTVSNHERTVQALASVNSSTGQVQIISWQQINL